MVSIELNKGILGRFLKNFESEPQLLDYVRKSVGDHIPTAMTKIAYFRAAKFNNILPTQFITTVFSATVHHVDLSTPTTTRFGFLFSDCDKTHQYISCAGTYKSKDGEYRKGFKKYKDWYGWWNQIDITRSIEDYLLSQLGKTIDLSVSFCFPDEVSERDRNEFANMIDEQRLIVYAFMHCWLCNRPAIEKGFIANHISPSFKLIFGNFGDRLYEDILSIVPSDELHRIANYLDFMNEKTKYIENVKINNTKTNILGFKLFPLNKEEVQYDIPLSKSWKEVYLGEKINDLIINLICHNFAFTNGWSFLPGANPLIYENLENYSKFITQEDISEENDIHSMIKKTDENENKFLPLDMKLGGIQPNIMSNTALIIQSEYIGSVLKDIPRCGHSIEKNYIVKVTMDSKYYKKNIFELLYSIYSYNSIYGIIHTELDDNNITFNDIQHNKPEGFYNFYHIENNSWAFLVNKIRWHIIDFSQAIFGNIELIKEDFGEDVMRKFEIEQRPILEKIFQKYAPDFYTTNRDFIIGAIEERLQEVIEVISIVDVVGALKNVIDSVSPDTQFPNYQPDPKNIEFTTIVYESALRLLRRNLDLFLAGKKIPTKNTILELIIEQFADHEVRNSLDQFKNRADNHFLVREPTYKIKDYSMWPPHMKVETILDAYKVVGVAYDPEYNTVLDFYSNNRRQITDEEFRKRTAEKTITGGDEYGGYDDVVDEWGISDNDEESTVEVRSGGTDQIRNPIGEEEFLIDLQDEWMWT